MVGKWLVRSVIIMLPLICLLQNDAMAQESSDKKESCVTDKCHAGMGKERFVHGPVAVGDCLTCHKQIRKHKFAPITDIGKNCDECHAKLTTMKVVHAPVREGKCTKCHDPHQSAFKFQLHAAGGDLCFKCHDKSIVGHAFVHGPAAVGSCSTCHTMHQSEFPKLLLAQANEVCFTCHADKGEAVKEKKFVHAPAEEACTGCHNPHSGNFRFSLTAEGSQDLCFTCHADKDTEIKEATVTHKGLDTARKCLTCHDPHASNHVKQLVKQPVDLCMTCHDREYQGEKGGLADMKTVLAENMVHHGPIKQQDCSGCHNTHGSSNFRMLREAFPQVFYAGYSEDNYKLCFMCHEKTLASNEKTATLTGFRNGEQNLHFVHVNRSVKGRTCRACHDAHATNNPRHIRDSVPFASWQLPVGFTKTESGGRCLPGCHQVLGYDRVKPVLNKQPVARR